MTIGVVNIRPVARIGGRFYLIMSLVLLAIAAFGFSHTIPGDFATPGFPPLLAIHGVVFAAWVLLFVAQPALLARGSIALHRKLGWLGVGLAVAMVGMGSTAILMALWQNTLPPFYPHGLFIVRGAMGLLVFAGLVTGGIALRRRGEWHKRLMLCASIIVVVPALERGLPIPLFGAVWPFVVDGVVDVIALVGPATDLALRRRIHPAYFWGVGAIVLGQIAVDRLAPSHLATMLLHLAGAS